VTPILTPNGTPASTACPKCGADREKRVSTFGGAEICGACGATVTEGQA